EGRTLATTSSLPLPCGQMRDRNDPLFACRKAAHIFSHKGFSLYECPNCALIQLRQFQLLTMPALLFWLGASFSIARLAIAASLVPLSGSETDDLPENLLLPVFAPEMDLNGHAA